MKQMAEYCRFAGGMVMGGLIVTLLCAALTTTAEAGQVAASEDAAPPDCIPALDLTSTERMLSGACCVAGVCVATNTESECALLGGDWFEGETCPEFDCPAPGGDNCDNPIEVILLDGTTYTDTNTTCGRGNDYSAYCCYDGTCLGDDYDGEEIVYKLIIPERIAEHIKREEIIPGMGVELAVVLDNSCPSDGDCMWFSAEPDGGTHESPCMRLLSGTYYLTIDCPSGCGDFDLIIEDCEPEPIPTVSEWGLVVLALLLLAGAKVYFGRRYATARNL